MTPVAVEPTLKYHPDIFELAPARIRVGDSVWWVV